VKKKPKDALVLSPEEKRHKLQEVYGAQMASLLYYIKTMPAAPIHVKLRAEELQKKWDGVSNLRLLNPYTAIELEKALQ
jgi:type III secretory pathway lipoprotein EscJ